MKFFLTTAVITSLSAPAFAGADKDHTPTKVETKSSKSQSVDAQYPEHIRSQVLLGGLSESHKKVLLEQQRTRDLYN